MRLTALSGAVPGQTNQNPELRNLVMANMTAAAPWLAQAEFYTYAGSADAPAKNAGAVGGSKRSLNGTYTGSATAPAFGASDLKIYGDEIKTDIAYERRLQSIGGERRRQLESFGKAVGRTLTDDMINGSGAGTPKAIPGLLTLMPSGQKIILGGGANGDTVTLGNDNTARGKQQQYIEALLELCRRVRDGAGLIFMNYKAMARTFTIAREYVTYQSVQNAIGEPMVLASFNGVPVLDPGYKQDDSTLVLPNTLTCGTSTDCTSIIAVRYGEKQDLTWATNVGVQVADKGIIGTQYVTMVDFDIDQVLLNDRAVAELDGVRIP